MSEVTSPIHLNQLVKVSETVVIAEFPLSFVTLLYAIGRKLFVGRQVSARETEWNELVFVTSNLIGIEIILTQSVYTSSWFVWWI